jgi:hypothetical protein
VAFAACPVREDVAACCNEPDVAVIVTVDVEDGLDTDRVQPTSTAMPNAHAINNSDEKLSHFFRLNRHSPAANTDPGNQRPDPLRRAANCVVVVTVSVETILPSLMTVVGEKLHVAPAGGPEQAKAIADEETNSRL